MSNMSDGLNMQPRVREPESPSVVPGMGVPVSAPSDLQFRPQPLGASPLSTQFPPSIADTSTAFAQPPGASLQQPASWQYDFDPATGSARATFAGEVQFISGGSSTSGVTSWNGRSGSVTLTSADITGAGGATLASPALTGTPTAPTASLGTSTTQIATTAFVAQQIAGTTLVSTFNGRSGAVVLSASDITSAGGAPAASPALTGIPTAPTASVGNNSTQVATTAFVTNQIAAGTVVSFNGRSGTVTLALSDVMTVGGAPIASPAFTGVPTGTTATPGTSTTQLATTAFVTNAVSAATSGVSSFNTRTGPVTLQAADVAGVGGALLLSPNFTGTPTAPTATAGTSTTQLATTAFVANAVAATAGVSSFNGRTGPVTLTIGDVTSAGGAPTASPTFTGTPAAPTATAGTSTTQIATTAFVATAVTAVAIPVPVTVANGGTGTTNLGTGLGIVTSPSATGSFSKTPFPATGIAVVDNTGAAFAASAAFKSGTNPVTDVSPAGLSISGNWVWQRIGSMVMVMTQFTFPSTSDGNYSSLGGLPYAPALEAVGNFYTNGNVLGVFVAVGKNASNLIRSTGNLIGIAVSNSQISTNNIAISMTYYTTDPP